VESDGWLSAFEKNLLHLTSEYITTIKIAESWDVESLALWIISIFRNFPVVHSIAFIVVINDPVLN
jgi:hypothetical protein